MIIRRNNALNLLLQQLFDDLLHHFHILYIQKNIFTPICPL